MNSYDWASLIAWEGLELADPTFWPAMEPSWPFSLIPLTKPRSARIGPVLFSEDQLEYVFINLEHAGGINTTSDVVFVMKYKWPDDFELLIESDLEIVMRWLDHNCQATECVDIKDSRVAEGLTDAEPSREGECINDYKDGEPLDSDVGEFMFSEPLLPDS